MQRGLLFFTLITAILFVGCSSTEEKQNEVKNQTNQAKNEVKNEVKNETKKVDNAKTQSNQTVKNTQNNVNPVQKSTPENNQPVTKSTLLFTFDVKGTVELEPAEEQEIYNAVKAKWLDGKDHKKLASADFEKNIDKYMGNKALRVIIERIGVEDFEVTVRAVKVEDFGGIAASQAVDTWRQRGITSAERVAKEIQFAKDVLK